MSYSSSSTLSADEGMGHPINAGRCDCVELYEVRLAICACRRICKTPCAL